MPTTVPAGSPARVATRRTTQGRRPAARDLLQEAGVVVGVPRPSGHVPPYVVVVQCRKELCGVAGRVGGRQLDDPPAQDDAGRRWPGHLRPGRVDGPGVGHGSDRRRWCAGSTVGSGVPELCCVLAMGRTYRCARRMP